MAFGRGKLGINKWSGQEIISVLYFILSANVTKCALSGCSINKIHQKSLTSLHHLLREEVNLC